MQGDLALLNMTDGSCNDGKTWHTFEWALRHFPDADLFFKQDDDTIVDWRLALPRMLNRRLIPVTPAARPLRRLYVGTYAANYSCPSVMSGIAPCAAGALYGLSGDIVKWIVDNVVTAIGEWEDMETCRWVRRFELEHKEHRLRQQLPWRLDPRGLLEALTGQIGGAWVHPVKEVDVYWKCILDRVNGCRIPMFPGGSYRALLHFLLPPRSERAATRGCF
ncbi:unnamed protein product [Polarella glacialis]|nr:unnamed protein product [Polarella glacialis]